MMIFTVLLLWIEHQFQQDWLICHTITGNAVINQRHRAIKIALRYKYTADLWKPFNIVTIITLGTVYWSKEKGTQPDQDSGLIFKFNILLTAYVKVT